MTSFLRDLRISARVLLKEKSFSILAIAILTLGICAVTTQFSLVHAFLIRGLPVVEPEQLVSVALRDPTWPAERMRPPAATDYMEWTRQQTSFQGLASYYTNGSFIVVRDGPAQRLRGGHVTANFFSLLRTTPALGRDFTDADNRPLNETPRVTIISDSLWETEFARDPGILGRTFRLNGAPATVIGVMPPEFQFTRDQLWIPIFNEYPPTAGGGAPVFGRLKPGATVEQAAAEITTLTQRLARDKPVAQQTVTQARVEPMINRFVDRETRGLMLVMLGAVAAVLAIACVNVTNLQFARATARSRELAVRTALGAARARLIAQMLGESLLLVAAGSAAGVLLSLWTTDLLQKLIATAAQSSAIQPPPWLKFEINGPVLAFTLGAAALSVVLAGLLPAWFASRANPIDALREGGRGHTSRFVNRLTRSLVIGQIALTYALLVASLLLIRSIVNQQRQALGYDGAAVITTRTNLETEFRNATELRAFYPQLLATLRGTPGVAQAALTSRRNLVNVNTTAFEIEDAPAPAGREQPTVIRDVISDGYFATLGLRPLEGREFSPNDGMDPQNPVVLVNTTFAKKHFGHASAVGRRLRNNPAQPWATILGVVPDTLMQGPIDHSSDGAGIFIPLPASPQSYLTIVARGNAAPELLIEPLRRAVARINPNIALYAVTTPKTAFEQALLASRMIAGMFTIFGFVAATLATVGLYGVAAFAVSQRTHEFGVRMALGADALNIMHMVLRGGAVQFALGILFGLAATLALVQVGGATISFLLFKVEPHDPFAYGTVVLLLAAATLIACIVPARRATNVDPMIALRAD